MTVASDRTQSPGRRPPANRQFHDDVVRGLSRPVKELPCKYLYDAAGAALFERITQLDEYYLTRTELAIMERYAADMAQRMGGACLLVEYGSGSGRKTRLLLDHLHEPAGYVPVDVSCEQLSRTAQALAAAYPAIEILPVCADFTRPLQLPAPRRPDARRVVYFPGSTIGNFTPAEARALLRQTAQLCGPGGGLLLGADLQKDPGVIDAAYNDRQGVTASFNRNLLVRINRELGANFAVDQFEHLAFYDERHGRIEIYLVSRRDQSVRVGNATFFFPAGDSIRTEYSYKYQIADLERLGEGAAFRLAQTWTDERNYFSVSFFTV